MVDVRRGGERARTRGDGLLTRHSFSFGDHYDPTNVGLAALVAHNDDRVEPGHGYDPHPHADLEIVTWVLAGSLVHTDSTGRTTTVGAGEVQWLGAGSGVRHSERNDEPGAAVPTRFVQMWLRPDEPALPPAYDVRPAGHGGRGGALVPLASGIRGLDAPVPVRTAGAALHLARLGPGEAVGLPDAPHLHVFVARGQVDLEGAGRLVEGDAARFTGEGGPRLTGVAAAEVLVWQLG